ncbi:MAG: polyribonucleotide nucleotidyltransferase, partial [Candidatus Omnitrophica bacterium CG12_big_fil_rev_8_21_14_0_65_50_5]
MIGASAALTISDIPFAGPIGAVRVGLVDGEFVLNPTFEQREMSSVDLVMAGPEAGVVMIEGEASEVPESKLVEALKFGSKTLAAVIAAQKDLHKQIGKKKTEVNLIPPNEKLSK